MTKTTARSAASISTAPGAKSSAVGVRNTVGFDWNPVNKQLYFSDNGRDWLSEDVPQDELNRVTKVGQHFGAPYCYQGNLPRSGIRLGAYVPRIRRRRSH